MKYLLSSAKFQVRDGLNVSWGSLLRNEPKDTIFFPSGCGDRASLHTLFEKNVNIKYIKRKPS